MPHYHLRPATLSDAGALVRHREAMFTEMGSPAADVAAAGPMFRSWLSEAMPTGVYRAWVEGRVAGRSQRASATEFEVVLPSRENQDPAPDPETLRTLAQKTGGVFLDLAHARALASQFPGGEERREPISSRLEDAWDDWHTLLLALGLLSAEWILRKRCELL